VELSNRSASSLFACFAAGGFAVEIRLATRSTRPYRQQAQLSDGMWCGIPRVGLSYPREESVQFGGAGAEAKSGMAFLQTGSHSSCWADVAMMTS
jgi:hypothetical protein